jgi:hypothetical protein
VQRLFLKKYVVVVAIPWLAYLIFVQAIKKWKQPKGHCYNFLISKEPCVYVIQNQMFIKQSTKICYQRYFNRLPLGRLLREQTPTGLSEYVK